MPLPQRQSQTQGEQLPWRNAILLANFFAVADIQYGVGSSVTGDDHRRVFSPTVKSLDFSPCMVHVGEAVAACLPSGTKAAILLDKGHAADYAHHRT
jgi:hypothetical protein